MFNEPIHVTDAAFEKSVLQSESAGDRRFLGTLVRTLQNGRAHPG